MGKERQFAQNQHHIRVMLRIINYLRNIVDGDLDVFFNLKRERERGGTVRSTAH
jgi:hypothetical protein